MDESKMTKDGAIHKTLTVEAAKSGWIVREKGKPAEAFQTWQQAVRKLEIELTSKGNQAWQQGVKQLEIELTSNGNQTWQRVIKKLEIELTSKGNGTE